MVEAMRRRLRVGLIQCTTTRGSVPNYIMEITVVRMVVFGFALFRLSPACAALSARRPVLI
jgi:hypothetical protein